jgi:hypothetical protein
VAGAAVVLVLAGDACCCGGGWANIEAHVPVGVAVVVVVVVGVDDAGVCTLVEEGCLGGWS